MNPTTHVLAPAERIVYRNVSDQEFNMLITQRGYAGRWAEVVNELGRDSKLVLDDLPPGLYSALYAAYPRQLHRRRLPDKTYLVWITDKPSEPECD